MTDVRVFMLIMFKILDVRWLIYNLRCVSFGAPLMLLSTIWQVVLLTLIARNAMVGRS